MSLVCYIRYRYDHVLSFSLTRTRDFLEWTLTTHGIEVDAITKKASGLSGQAVGLLMHHRREHIGGRSPKLHLGASTGPEDSGVAVFEEVALQMSVVGGLLVGEGVAKGLYMREDLYRAAPGVWLGEMRLGASNPPQSSPA